MKKSHLLPFSRRQFLTQSAAVGMSVVSSRSLLASSANEQINIGIIGCGWRGGQLLESFLRIKGVKVAGLCDPDQEILGKVAANVPDVQTWTDLRHMLDSPSIDAVVIAAPNHWHCLAAIWAMQAGKDVYVEKPLGQTEWEGQQLVNAVKKYGRICQVGTQQRSDPMQEEVRDFLHVGRELGPIKYVIVNRLGVRESIGKREQPLQTPGTLDYNLWLGPAVDQPIFRSNLHYDWHWKWNTGSGEMGNWGVHILDDVRGNVFLDQVQAPAKVCATGGRYVWNDAGDTPNLHFAMFLANSIPVVMSVCNLASKKGARPLAGPPSGYVVYCEGGRYEGQRGAGGAFDSAGKELRKFQGDSGEGHQENFIAAVRTRDPLVLKAPVHVGQASTSWSNLANIATRVQSTTPQQEQPSEKGLPNFLVKEFGEQTTEMALQYFRQVNESHQVGDIANAPMLRQVLAYDCSNMQFTGPAAEAANALLKRQDREPFVVPLLAST